MIPPMYGMLLHPQHPPPLLWNITWRTGLCNALISEGGDTSMTLISEGGHASMTFGRHVVMSFHHSLHEFPS